MSTVEFIVDHFSSFNILAFFLLQHICIINENGRHAIIEHQSIRLPAAKRNNVSSFNSCVDMYNLNN